MSRQLECGAGEEDDDLTKNYIEYSIEINRWLLRPIAVWPICPNASMIDKIFSKIQIATCYFLICFLLVPCGLHTFLEEDDLALRLKMIGPLSICIAAIIKYYFMVTRRNEIFKCLEHIAKDWLSLKSSKDQEIMLIYAKFGRFVASLFAAFLYGGGFFYHTIMPLSYGVIITDQNVSIRPLCYPVYDAYLDVMKSPTYEIVFVTQWFSGFVLCTIGIGACSMAAVFAMHACGQFNVLMARLDKLVDSNDSLDTVDNRIADIVELHIRALGFVSRVESLLNEVCLLEFLGGTMIICFLGYYCMTEWEQNEAISTVTYCILLVTAIFNILIYCYIGEMLTEESKRVGAVTYMIDWHQLQGTKARGLILILVMSKTPASITAGKIAELSLSSFGDVLKTALTYLNLLRQLTL